MTCGSRLRNSKSFCSDHRKDTVTGDTPEGTVTGNAPGQPPTEPWVKAKLKK
jgi:hypothetical protein